MALGGIKQLSSYPLLDARTGMLCALSQAGRFEVVDEVFNSVGFFVEHILQELRFTGSVKNHELYDFVLNIFPSKRQTTPWLHELQVQTTRISVQSY